MDPQKIGQFIIELRKEKQMSQENLANLIPISRQAISKWENGKTCPDNSSLSRLSTIFKVSINELLSGKRLNKNNYDDITLNLYKNNNSNKRKFKLLIIIILIITLSFLFYYIINVYNDVKIYLISGENENVQINNGILVITREKIYFKVGEITNINNKTIKDITIYYNDKENKEIEIHSCENCQNLDVLLIDRLGYNIYFDYNNIDFISKNMKLKILYEDNTTDIIKLLLKQDFQHNLFKKNTPTAMLENNNIQKVISENNYLNDLLKFKNNNDGYTFKDKENNIEINYVENILTVEKNDSNYTKYWVLDTLTDTLNYELYSKKEIVNNMALNLKNNNCLSENCDTINQIKKEFFDIIESHFK